MRHTLEPEPGRLVWLTAISRYSLVLALLWALVLPRPGAAQAAPAANASQPAAGASKTQSPGKASSQGSSSSTGQATGQQKQQQAAPAMPSLQSLGFPSSETQSNPAEQARLNRRSHMLQIHQKLGLITAIPLIATVVAGAWAGGRPSVTSRTGRNVHMALGLTTVGLYAATAYYAFAAPHIHGVKMRGQTRAHVDLVWIHLPGMILTPILGEMAYAQRARGERVHGIAKLHGAVAMITLGAYMTALLVEARPHFFSNASHSTTSFLSSTGRDALAFLHLHHANDTAEADAFAGPGSN